MYAINTLPPNGSSLGQSRIFTYSIQCSGILGVCAIVHRGKFTCNMNDILYAESNSSPHNKMLTWSKLMAFVYECYSEYKNCLQKSRKHKVSKRLPFPGLLEFFTVSQMAN